MFGGVAAMVNGNIFGGLFGRSAIVKLSPTDQAEALALDGAEMFDPMGNGRVMTNTVFLPETVMDELDELRAWLRRAFDYGVTLPPKQKKAKAAAKAARPTNGKAAAPTNAKVAAKAKTMAKVAAAKARMAAAKAKTTANAKATMAAAKAKIAANAKAKAKAKAAAHAKAPKAKAKAPASARPTARR
jgi:TfoX/Sxy family transcriptional regulator of competence genes